MDDTELDGAEKEAESAWHSFWRRVLAPQQPLSEMTEAQRRYDTIATFPMFLAALLWMLSALFRWIPSLSEDYGRTGFILGSITVGLFLIDLLIRLILDPHKRSFFAHDWPLLIAVVFPPLRVLLVASAVMRIRRDRNALAKIVGLYAVYSVALVVIFGSVLTLAFEIDAPGSTIRSYGDSVWWGFETVSTVGYGDFTPVTVPGRSMAVLIMFVGAAAVGAVTAAVASRFINTGGAPQTAPAPTPDAANHEELTRQMAALQAQIEQIAIKLGVVPGASPDGG